MKNLFLTRFNVNTLVFLVLFFSLFMSLVDYVARESINIFLPSGAVGNDPFLDASKKKPHNLFPLVYEEQTKKHINLLGTRTSFYEKNRHSFFNSFTNETFDKITGQHLQPSYLQISQTDQPRAETLVPQQGKEETLSAESMQEFYYDWLHLLLEEIKGPDWLASHPGQRPTDVCSENLKLKNQGCALFIPACQKVTLEDNKFSQTGWSCEMVIWSLCRCSRPYTSFLKYLIPPTHECYGSVLHTYDLASSLGVTVEYKEMNQNDRILIPLGYCGWSGFFLFYLLIVLSFFVTLAIIFLGLLRRFKFYFTMKKKKIPHFSMSSLKHAVIG